MQQIRTPRPIERLDRGAEHYGYLGKDSVWHVVTKPASGIERDRMFVYEAKTGTAREIVSDAEFQKVKPV
jgi:hypothetical protein